MAVIYSLLPYIQIALSVLLTTAILLQVSEASVGGAFGASDSFGSGYHTRRGFEKVMFNATIVLAILFVISTCLALAQ